ncbi:MAG TPA: methylenetetrahydrofolate reductase [Xanthobacteraceae bacterium]|nr:methylenetetrahydrofolate reductase [Xanthobacteraceae bacterium]
MLNPHKLESLPDAPDFNAVLDDISLEAVMPSAAEQHEAASVLPTGTPIYLTDLPNRSDDKFFEIAKGLFMRGLKPVPHVSARNVPSERALETLLSRLASSACVRKVMLVGGDRGRSAGPFENALDVIESEILQRSGIEEIGVAGYPQGHPALSDDILRVALREKLDAARRAGLRAHIVTQFSFDAWPVVTWLRALRAEGVANPVRIGMAGPAGIPALLRFAQRCGVRTSVRGFARNAASIGKMFSQATPAEMVRDLAEAAASENLGEIAAHIYSFGGLPQTAKWARDAQRGELN